MEALQLLKFSIKKERPNFMASWAALDLDMVTSESMENPLNSDLAEALESTEDPLSTLLKSGSAVLDEVLGGFYSSEEDENVDEL